MNAVVLTDLRSYVTLASFLESRRRNLMYKSSNTSTIADLEAGPAILIGAFDNPWALRFSSALRFRFGTNPDMQEFWIGSRFFLVGRASLFTTERAHSMARSKTLGSKRFT